MSGENARHGLKAAFWTESFELKDHQFIPWNENKNFIVYIDDIINESFFFFLYEKFLDRRHIAKWCLFFLYLLVHLRSVLLVIGSLSQQ